MDNKKYIEDQYKIAWLDFKTAYSENERWSARIRMAKLEALASELFGYDYADKLSAIKDNGEVKGQRS